MRGGFRHPNSKGSLYLRLVEWHQLILDEKPKQEHTEPVHHRKAIIKGITVYESFRPEGSELWDCLLQSMGKH